MENGLELLNNLWVYRKRLHIFVFLPISESCPHVEINQCFKF